uniref:Uncharacterized protein n=1 Tax=viral metagenome TaxID=1070528 RepID=A0A6M3M4I8_9ZZZZ
MKKLKNRWKTIDDIRSFSGMAKETVNTYVYDRSHKKVKGFAGLRGVDVPDAYEMLVTAGLKAMGYDPSTFK